MKVHYYSPRLNLVHVQGPKKDKCSETKYYIKNSNPVNSHELQTQKG